MYVYQHHITFENGSEYKVASTKIVSTTKSFVKESFEEYSSWHLTAFAKNRFFLDLTRRAMSKGKKQYRSETFLVLVQKNWIAPFNGAFRSNSG